MNLLLAYKSRMYEYGWRTFVRRNGWGWAQVRPRHDSKHWDFIADPFLFERDGCVWLFCETVDDNWKGRIECFQMTERGWKPLGVVLEKPCHLSYPQVFEEDGHVYMIPEQSDKGRGTVDLYEAQNFPFGWTKVKTLIDRPFADATLLKKGGRYYMACYTIPPHETAELCQADSLTGTWRQHPCSSQMHQEAKYRRCGGAFVEDETGNLYRVAQDCDGRYGLRLYRIPILELSPTAYREGIPETLMDEFIDPQGFKHTYNRIATQQGTFEVCDVQSQRMLSPFVVIARLLLRLVRGGTGQ